MSDWMKFMLEDAQQRLDLLSRSKAKVTTGPYDFGIDAVAAYKKSLDSFLATHS